MLTNKNQPDDQPDPESQFGPGLSSAQRKRLLQLSQELFVRKTTALKLYRPLEVQQQFHTSMASERIVRGGNRSGKTVSAAVEVARAALGLDPQNKFPSDRPLMIWCIGYGENHIGRVIHNALFRHGSFKIIRDLETQEWRAFDPNSPIDLVRENEARPAPPLISDRHIISESWVNKGERVFSVIRLHAEGHPMHGTEIWAFSSMSQQAPMGSKVDLIWIDEDIKYDRHIPELQARLSDTKGRFIWSALPYSNNDALVDLVARATKERDENKPKRNIEEFRLTFRANPHIDAEEKQKQYERWDEDEISMRDLGEFAMDSRLIYPSFSQRFHVAPHFDHKNEFDRILSEGVVPLDWCRYMSVDPGHTVCAVVFAAVPPPHLGDYVLIEDELYIKNCDAAVFAQRVADKVEGRFYHAFIIDDCGSRQTNAGSGKSIREQYTEELTKRRVASKTTGHGFMPGSDDILGRISIVRTWLRTRTDLTPKLRYLKNHCPMLLDEFAKYKKHMDSEGKVSDKPKSRYNAHVLNAVEYLAAYDPKYHKPEPPRIELNPVLTLFRQWKSDIERKGRPSYINLGPGAAKAG